MSRLPLFTLLRFARRHFLNARTPRGEVATAHRSELTTITRGESMDLEWRKRLEKGGILGDIPRVITLKADDRSRVKLPDAKPGAVFAYQTEGKVIRLVPVKEDDQIPVVKPVKGADGLYSLPRGVTLSRAEIRAAIRADRD